MEKSVTSNSSHQIYPTRTITQDELESSMQAHWTSVNFATFEIQDEESKMTDILMRRRHLPEI